MIQVSTISVAELKKMAEAMYGGLVKAVVDVNKRTMVVDAELHVDEEQYLLEQGSQQNDLWGINLYPDEYGTENFVEFDSMINIRPSLKNMDRGVNDPRLREAIQKIVTEKIVA